MSNDVVIRHHHDSDGITTAFFTAHHLDWNCKLECWDGKFGESKGLKKGDWMVDMHPTEIIPGMNIVDHHGEYGLVTNYHLIYGPEPASFLAWREFKEDIPKDQWWKLCIGVVGDGQPELIPYEVFESCPRLLVPHKTWGGAKNYGKDVALYFYPTYKMLSSPINRLLKTGNSDGALRLITEAKSPIDILEDKEAGVAKTTLKKERDIILRDCDVKKFNNLNLVLFYSKYRMQGEVASIIEGIDNITTLAINVESGRGSLRGELALYWKEKLKGLEYLNIDGHPGFMGASLDMKKKNPEGLVDDLISLLS